MRFLCVFVTLIMFSKSLYAKEACYSMAEAEAEQGIRIHSELMVIGLNCQHLWPNKNGQSLFQQYRTFTSDHANIFTNYDSSILRFYMNQGYSNSQAESKLNNIRTGVANKISNDAAKMRPDLFCKAYAPRIEKASVMSDAKIRKWAQTFFESHPLTYPLCANEEKVVAKKVVRKKYITAP